MAKCGTLSGNCVHFHCYKWANIENFIQPSDHTAVDRSFDPSDLITRGGLLRRLVSSAQMTIDEQYWGTSSLEKHHCFGLVSRSQQSSHQTFFFFLGNLFCLLTKMFVTLTTTCMAHLKKISTTPVLLVWIQLICYC